MIVRAETYVAFLSAFSIANGAGAGPYPIGGNELLLPDETPADVLDAVAAVPGVSIPDRPATPAAEQPAKAATAKAKTRRTSSSKE
jgi:hypothetical protein